MSLLACKPPLLAELARKMAPKLGRCQRWRAGCPPKPRECFSGSCPASLEARPITQPARLPCSTAPPKIPKPRHGGMDPGRRLEGIAAVPAAPIPRWALVSARMRELTNPLLARRPDPFNSFARWHPTFAKHRVFGVKWLCARLAMTGWRPGHPRRCCLRWVARGQSAACQSRSTSNVCTFAQYRRPRPPWEGPPHHVSPKWPTSFSERRRPAWLGRPARAAGVFELQPPQGPSTLPRYPAVTALATSMTFLQSCARARKRALAGWPGVAFRRRTLQSRLFLAPPSNRWMPGAPRTIS